MAYALYQDSMVPPVDTQQEFGTQQPLAKLKTNVLHPPAKLLPIQGGFDAACTDGDVWMCHLWSTARPTQENVHVVAPYRMAGLERSQCGNALVRFVNKNGFRIEL